MATKKLPPSKAVTLLGYGEIKMTDAGLTIQGFANKAVVDRGNEIISVDAWDLENYKKNPVILYNHGFDPQLGSTPVGAATEVTPTKDGLFIKARLSGVDDPLINRIRGLVHEKILRAFSVGFNPVESSDDPKSGLKTITKAELFEVSIVGVPMNQDSLFEVTSKMLKSMSNDDLRSDILKRKGAWVAAAVHNAMYNKQKAEKLLREDILSAIAEKAGLEEDMLSDILAGNLTPVPEAVLAAFAEVLGLNLDELKKLDAGDVEVEKAAKKPDDQAPPAAGDQGAAAQTQASGDQSPDTAKAPVGTGSGEANQDGTKAPTFSQRVEGEIRKLIGEGKEQDQAVALAINACNEGQAKAHKPSKDEYAAFFKLADTLKQADQGVTQPPTTEISVDRTAAANNDFGSPMLEAQKQTNVLLGALINEMQKVSLKLDGLQPQPGKDGTAASDGGAVVTDTNAAPPPAEGEMAAPVAAEAPTSDGTPTESMTPEELKTAQDARAKTFGIEALPDGASAFPAGGPQSLAGYGDPVNLKFPIDTAETASKSRDEFKKAAGDYQQDSSKTVVHGMIVSAQLALGGDPSYDEKDPLDGLLPQAIKDKLAESNTKALDSYRKRLDHVKKRLLDMGA